VLHPTAAAAVLRHWRENRGTGDIQDATPALSVAPTLTPRESQVLSALGEGWTTKRIGRELSVSPKTVETHIGKLLVKLNVRNRAQAISQARRYGLVDAAGEPAE
jgi:DNA-binding NarL/FixJ family response regulator